MIQIMKGCLRKRYLRKKKKRKKGRKGQWPENFVDDLADVILDDEKIKEKLLLTNVKNKKSGQYYGKVIELISLRSKERNEEFSFSVAQTHQTLHQYM